MGEKQPVAVTVNSDRAKFGTSSIPSWFLAELTPPETAIANAHLIAAAPDLYEALQAMIDVASDRESFEEFAPAFDKARAALAKAEGKNEGTP